MTPNNSRGKTKKRITNCLDGHSEILMYNGTVKELKNIKIGDIIYGVELIGRNYCYTKATVLHLAKTKKKSYIITLKDDREIICSGEQLWLTSKGWSYTIRNNSKEVLHINEGVKGFITYPYEHMQEPNGIQGICAKSSPHLRVKSIKPYMGEQTLYDLITTTESFVANGIVGYSATLTDL